MNKGITILLTLVILGAMGMVLFSHINNKNDLAATGKSGNTGGASADKKSAGGTGAGTSVSDLIRIDPPLSSLNPPPDPTPAGAPRAVRLTAGSDAPTGTPAPSGFRSDTRGRTDENHAAPPTRQSPAGEAPARQDAAGQDAARPPGGPPGLTPWENPPQANQAARTNGSPTADAAPGRPGPAVTAQASLNAAGASPDSASGTAQTPESRRPSAPPAAQGRANTSERQAPAGETARQNAAPETPRPATAPARTPALPSDRGAHTLKNISLTFDGNDMRLLIEADNDFPCKTFALSEPDRLVIDLPGTWKGMKAPTVPGNRIIRKVRIGLQSAGPRLVLDLSSPLKNHRVERRGNMVEITVQ
ncbi:MAG: AMIN domain-containing protein [Desulfovibrio sp.]|jgi:N-acetylmuramoyl-L-alanine amidase|nr:AMIN domain-containing protein [Desulfovibrio sp.]